MVDISEQRVEGYFIGETATHLIFQEKEEGTDNLLDIWKIYKTDLRYVPLLNIEGYLELDKSYYPVEENGELFIRGGAGRLIFFRHCPFLIPDGVSIPTQRPTIEHE